MIKKGVQLALIIFAFYATDRLCRRATDGFAVIKIAAVPSGEAGPAPLAILNQRFSYLGKGGQCYAFVSEDGQYVIKFFRKHRDLQKTFESVRLAYDRLKQETGLVYIHLGKNPKSMPSLQIVDKLQIAHTIDPNAYGWVLQRRAELVRPHLAFLMEAGKVEEAKQALSALFVLLKQISDLGVADGDANLAKNFGFLEEQPIEIDVGRFEASYRGCSRFEQSKEDLIHWLNAHYPTLSPHLEEEFRRFQN